MILTHRPLHLACTLVAAFAPILVGATAHAAPPNATKSSLDSSDDNAKLRSLFRKAAAASEAGKYEEARDLLSDAWAIRQTYDVASSLAQVEIQLRLYRDAAEHLEFCLRNFAPVESEQTLEQAKKAFADVKTRVATVRFSATRKGAELFVDGRGVGTEPLPAVVFVEPGLRELAARLDGESAEQSLNAQAGKEYVLELQLGTREPKAAPTERAVIHPPEPTPPPVAHKPDYAPVIVTLSVGGTALVTSLVLLIEANRKDSQREDRLDRLPGSNRCGAQTPTPSACREIQSLADDAQTFRSLAWVGFGAAAAAGVATYFLWPRRPDSAQLGIRATAVPTRTGVDFYAGFSGIF